MDEETHLIYLALVAHQILKQHDANVRIAVTARE